MISPILIPANSPGDFFPSSVETKWCPTTSTPTVFNLTPIDWPQELPEIL